MKDGMTVMLSLLGMMVLGATQSVHAVVFGGIDFPAGEASFADEVLTYDNLFSGGPAPTDGLEPTEALGPPDSVSVTLGRGGLLEVLFTDNLLTNSGDAGFDLHIFEIGPDVEDTFVAIRPTAATVLLLDPATFDTNSDGFYEVGAVSGATSSIDIDSFFPAAAAGTYRFDAVQLIDDPDEGQATGEFVGADIDAVGAIASVPSDDDGVTPPGVVPEPATASLLLLAGSILATRRRRA